jgi:hypothetical protein
MFTTVTAMKSPLRISPTLFGSILFSAALIAACPALQAKQPGSTTPAAPPTMASMMDAQLGMVEREVVGAAEAMPDDKYWFAPAGGEFSGVRTFSLEARHLATANFVVYSAILGQDPPAGVTVDGAANGPDSLRTKEQIVQYVKDSFALGHKAMASLNNQNALEPLSKPPIAMSFLNTRLALAIFSFSHASDHYGQMVEYLRMNGIVPPSSVGQPPANPETK